MNPSIKFICISSFDTFKNRTVSIYPITSEEGVLNNFPYLRGDPEFESACCEVHFFIKSP